MIFPRPGLGGQTTKGLALNVPRWVEFSSTAETELNFHQHIRGTGLTTVELEHTHRACQPARLLTQAFGRCRALFDQSCILLSNIVQLTHGLPNRDNALPLFGAGPRDFADQATDTLDLLDYVTHSLSRTAHEIRTRFDLIHAATDQASDVLRSLGAALSQLANLARYHSKAPPLLSGTRRLDRSVKRQDVGLESQAVDHTSDFRNLPRAAANLFHSRNHLPDYLTTLSRNIGSIASEPLRLLSSFGAMPNITDQLLHGRSRLLKLAGGDLGTPRKVLVTCFDLHCGLLDRVAASTDLVQDGSNFLDEPIESSRNLRHFITPMYR